MITMTAQYDMTVVGLVSGGDQTAYIEEVQRLAA